MNAKVVAVVAHANTNANITAKSTPNFLVAKELKRSRALSALILGSVLVMTGMHSSMAAEVKPLRRGVVTIIEEMPGQIAPAAMRNRDLKSVPANLKNNAGFVNVAHSVQNKLVVANTKPTSGLKLPNTAWATN